MNPDGVVGEEIVLFDVPNLVERDLESSYDWTNYVKPLFPIEFFFNPSLSTRNKHGQLTHFYFRNFHSWEVHQPYQRKQKDSLLVCTFNVHGFQSINTKDSPKKSFEALLRMIELNKIDLICLQEFKTVGTPREVIAGFSRVGLPYFEVTPKNAHFGDQAIFSAYPIRPLSSTHFIVEGFENAVFLHVHLEVGKPLYNNRGEPLPDFKELSAKNSAYRQQQIQALVIDHPIPAHIILGDCNFVKEDMEFQIITEQCNFRTMTLGETTPFGTQVDWVFCKPSVEMIHCQTISFPFSDHLPVLAELRMDSTLKRPRKQMNRSNDWRRTGGRPMEKTDLQREHQEFQRNKHQDWRLSEASQRASTGTTTKYIPPHRRNPPNQGRGW